MLATLPSLDLGISLPACDRGERIFESCEGEGAESSPDCLVPVGVAMACENKSVEEAPDFPSAKELFSAASFLQVKVKRLTIIGQLHFDSIRGV